jgi:RimJ/RimL family protein N-acetyltransferase
LVEIKYLTKNVLVISDLIRNTEFHGMIEKYNQIYLITSNKMQPLTEEEITLTSTLPKKFQAVSLQGFHIKIEPFNLERDIQILYDRTNGSSHSLGSKTQEEYDADEQIWRYKMDGPFESLSLFEESMKKLSELSDLTLFTIFDIETNSQIGYFAMMNNIPGFLRIEIGHVVICPVVQKRRVATEMIYLILGHTFGVGYRRVEWKCNDLNVRSKMTALSAGFTFEGIQKSQLIIKGKPCDITWFRMLKNEWERVKSRVLEKISSV